MIDVIQKRGLEEVGASGKHFVSRVLVELEFRGGGNEGFDRFVL